MESRNRQPSPIDPGGVIMINASEMKANFQNEDIPSHIQSRYKESKDDYVRAAMAKEAEQVKKLKKREEEVIFIFHNISLFICFHFNKMLPIFQFIYSVLNCTGLGFNI